MEANAAVPAVTPARRANGNGRLNHNRTFPGKRLVGQARHAAGTYRVELAAHRQDEEPGRESLLFHREDGVAESFHPEQKEDRRADRRALLDAR